MGKFEGIETDVSRDPTINSVYCNDVGKFEGIETSSSRIYRKIAMMWGNLKGLKPRNSLIASRYRDCNDVGKFEGIETVLKLAAIRDDAIAMMWGNLKGLKPIID